MYKILKLKNKKFEEIEVKNNIVEYEELSKAVEGYIEHITFNLELEKANIDVWCDEEGKLKELDLECIILDYNAKKVMEVIAGPLVFTSRDREGNSLSLSEKQIEVIKKVIDTKSYHSPVMPYR